MKKIVLFTSMSLLAFPIIYAQHKAELAAQAATEHTNQIILSPKKSFRLFKKHSVASQNGSTNDMPPRIQSILAADIRQSSETLISRVENKKSQPH
jgi:hypothetical protein